MLELSLIAVIGLAAIYWTALWWVGRHDDVLYGDFISSEGTAMLTAIEPSPRSQPAPVPPLPRTRRPPSLMAPTTPAPLPGTQPVAHRPALQQPVPQRPVSQPSVSQPSIISPAPASALVGAGLAPPTNLTAPPASRSAPLDSTAVEPPHEPSRKADQHDVLASLLETIKRDLNAAAGRP
ncbi:MAG: hypothetical protein ACOY6K_10520 [Pseudomonadota bacterium]